MSGPVPALTVNITCTLIDDGAPTNTFECPLPTLLSAVCRTPVLCEDDGFAIVPSTDDISFAFAPSTDNGGFAVAPGLDGTFDNDDADGNSGNFGTAAVGGAVGGGLALLLLVGLVVCVVVGGMRQKRARSHASNDTSRGAVEVATTSRRDDSVATEYADISTALRRGGSGDGYEVGALATADEYDSASVAHTRRGDYGHGDLAIVDKDYDNLVVAPARGDA
eukprot:CAMPEP_0198325586 /NCGR_PEP_ID=MMETSP1450-20131203/13309_1 /TAXON_ID=753684 ORGANISM="Madagascaria erythrocladiodes, Strain CCMP3234" /NCGR_SAMPLE_ID=MMETSP1450 /ASSEMBLY_ACC=CAM_ASM_001115 /LENGTH=221 /DNA_ID=CAMNT_0044029499 /DNA_START=195 /DNA_END=857 /DNA_ORIENTATION=+